MHTHQICDRKYFKKRTFEIKFWLKTDFIDSILISKTVKFWSIIDFIKKTAFRRQNAQITGKSQKSRVRNRLKNDEKVTKKRVNLPMFCRYFDEKSKIYRKKRKVLLCAFVTPKYTNFAKVFFYWRTKKWSKISIKLPRMGVKKWHLWRSENGVEFLDLVDTTI
jgi:hypothetical protein